MGILHITSPRTTDDMRIAEGIWKWLKRHTKPELSSDYKNIRVSFAFNGASDLGVALDAMTAWNVAAMRCMPIPMIYESGVTYRREVLCNSNGVVHTCEEWLTAHECVARKYCDCEDLGPYLAACYRLTGEKAQAYARPSACGWHILVRRADGSIEDPSAKLGMPTK